MLPSEHTKVKQIKRCRTTGILVTVRVSCQNNTAFQDSVLPCTRDVQMYTRHTLGPFPDQPLTFVAISPRASISQYLCNETQLNTLFYSPEDMLHPPNGQGC